MKKPKIVHFPKTLIIGKSIEMSLSNNLTGQLWQSFMPHRKEITNATSSDLYSLQVYPPGFTPDATFIKWAGCPVQSFDQIPAGMESLVIPEGEYAVFEHKGPPSGFQKTFGYIMGQWLPSSKYIFDDRPQFEIMGDRYLGQDNPESIEDVYIPIKQVNP